MSMLVFVVFLAAAISIMQATPSLASSSLHLYVDLLRLSVLQSPKGTGSGALKRQVSLNLLEGMLEQAKPLDHKTVMALASSMEALGGEDKNDSQNVSVASLLKSHKDTLKYFPINIFPREHVALYKQRIEVIPFAETSRVCREWHTMFLQTIITVQAIIGKSSADVDFRSVFQFVERCLELTLAFAQLSLNHQIHVRAVILIQQAIQEALGSKWALIMESKGMKPVLYSPHEHAYARLPFPAIYGPFDAMEWPIEFVSLIGKSDLTCACRAVKYLNKTRLKCLKSKTPWKEELSPPDTGSGLLDHAVLKQALLMQMGLRSETEFLFYEPLIAMDPDYFTWLTVYYTVTGNRYLREDVRFIKEFKFRVYPMRLNQGLPSVFRIYMESMVIMSVDILHVYHLLSLAYGKPGLESEYKLLSDRFISILNRFNLHKLADLFMNTCLAVDGTTEKFQVNTDIKGLTEWERVVHEIGSGALYAGEVLHDRDLFEHYYKMFKHVLDAPVDLRVINFYRLSMEAMRSSLNAR